MAKAQVTLYILLALVFLFGITLALVTSNRFTRIHQVQDDLIPSYYIESCLQEVSKEAVMRLFLQGGFTDVSLLSAEQREYSISPFYIYTYLYQDGESLEFSPSSISAQLASYLSHGLSGRSDSSLSINSIPSHYEEHGFKSCVDLDHDGNPFDELTERGWDVISFQDPIVNVTFTEQGIIFSADLQGTVFAKSGTEISGGRSYYTIDAPLLTILETTHIILSSAKRLDLLRLDRNSFVINSDDIIVSKNHLTSEKTTLWELHSDYDTPFIFLTRLEH